MLKRAWRLLAILFLFTLIFPSPVLAGEIGTHIAYGDVDQQIGILGMIRSKGPPANWPVTIMLSTSMSVDQLQRLANATGGFNVYLRVNGVESGLSESLAEQFGRNLAQVNWPQSGKRLVIFGNETNNLDREWKNVGDGSVTAGAKYARMFSAFMNGLGGTGKYDVSASAIDVYNSVYGINEFLSGGLGAWQLANARVTNAYDVGGSNKDGDPSPRLKSLDLLTAKTGGGGRRFYTEYGPDPYANLKVHLDFYRANTSVPDAENATTLVPNSCEGPPGFGANADDWLFMIRVGGEPKIFDQTGEEIEIGPDGSCTSSKKKFVYAGIEDVLWSRGSLPAKDLASRYMLTCGPSYFLKAEISGTNEIVDDDRVLPFDTIAKYCDPRKRNPALFNDKGPESALCYFDPVSKKLVVGDEKSINAKFPLYRRDSRSIVPKARTMSLEAFFGANISEPNVPGYTFMNTSPIRRLQPKDQSCREVVEYMRVAETLCRPENQASTNPSLPPELAKQLVPESRDDCALNVKSPSGKSLFQTWDALRKTVDDMNRGFDAKNMSYLRITYEDYCSGVTISENDEKLFDDLLEIHPTTFNGFKKAYLVYYNPSFEKDKEAPNLTPSDQILASTDIQTFFRKHERVKDPDRIDPAVHIIPLLVPSSVFVQKDDFQGLGQNTTHQSSFSRAMDIIRPQSLTELRQEQKAVEVAGIFNQLKNVNNNPLDGCLGGLPYLVNTGMEGFSGCFNPLDTLRAIKSDPMLSGPNAKASALRRSFQDLLTRRINIGIRNGELETVMGKTPPTNSEEYSARCADFPNEVASGLASNVNSFNHSLVFENLVELRARARITGDRPREKYGVRSYLLLPEDYRNVRDAEVDFLTFLLPSDAINNILNITDEGAREQSLLSSGVPAAPDIKQPNDQLVPVKMASQPGKLSRFLRMSGIFPKLTGFDVSDLPKTFRGPLPNPIPEPWATTGENLDILRPTITVSADVVPDNQSQQFNPLVPGGVLTRGIFELTAHILSPFGSKEYQEFFCGLESYWLGRPCTTVEAEAAGESVIQPGQDVCFNFWPTTAEANRLAGELKSILATEEQKALWTRYFQRPPGIPYLFETLPECDNKKCFEYVIDKTLETKLNDGTTLNPYMAIGIALNETGGLRSDKEDHSGNHFGCGVNSEGRVKSDTIPNKLNCMLRTLKSYKEERQLDNVASMKRYGYKTQLEQQGLLTRIRLVNNNYDPQCAKPAAGR